jgi:hypothetical protein
MTAPRMIAGLRRFRKAAREDTSGSAALEFALVMPLFLAIVVGSFNYGVMGYQMSALIGAVRAGAEYSAGYLTSANLNADTTTMAQGSSTIVSGFMNISSMTVTPASLTCSCSDGSTPSACLPGSGANRCSGGGFLRTWVNISATQSQAWFGMAGFSLASPLSATAKARAY